MSDPMATSIFTTLLVLLQMMCVIVVVAYLLTRSRIFSDLLDGRTTIKIQLLLIVVFGALSIYGTVSGVDVLGAIVNVRDLGPMVGGLIGGPVVGLGAGLVGAAYRSTLGGITVVPCTIATILAGLFGGLIWLANHRRFVDIRIAVLFAVLIEALHMGLTLLLVRPFSVALEVVTNVGLPMILANATGVFIFAFIISNLQNERRMQNERDILLREMERKNTELAIAAEIQQSFLPDTISQVEGFDVAAKSIMAKEVGGDFFDVIPFEVVPIQPGRMGVLIADVSGKGIPAALFMALSRIVVRVNATWYADDPAHAIHDANNLIAADSKAGMFVTLFYGILDHTSHTFTYVNAGHNPPVVYHPHTNTFTELAATGIAMGVLTDAEYTSKENPLVPGDVVVLYTDGITEAMNAKEEMFGEERLYEVIRHVDEIGAGKIMAKILLAVKAFTGDYPQSDDITLMVIRVV
jgi:sigma-B regulation protein RsbU (phosphoserine phosphatase)